MNSSSILLWIVVLALLSAITLLAISIWRLERRLGDVADIISTAFVGSLRQAQTLEGMADDIKQVKDKMDSHKRRLMKIEEALEFAKSIRALLPRKHNPDPENPA
jgi:hypothetical protein